MLERPSCLEPPPRGEKVYGLLREALRAADMTEDWQPARHQDPFTEAEQALVRQRATARA